MKDILKQKPRKNREKEVESLTEIVDDVLFSRTIIERAKAVDRLMLWLVNSDTAKPVVNVMLARFCMDFALTVRGKSGKQLAKIIANKGEAIEIAQKIVSGFMQDKQGKTKEGGE